MITGFWPIDDVSGDIQRPGSTGTLPVYEPASGQWDPAAGVCRGCSPGVVYQPPINGSIPHMGSYHTVTVKPGDPQTTVSITFTGNQIAVFCLLPPDLGEGVTTFMDVTFTLDSELLFTYTRPTTTSQWIYNNRVWMSDIISQGQHTLVVEPRADNGPSFLALDYFAYTFDDGTTSTSAPPIVVPSHVVSTPAPPAQQSTTSTANSNVAQSPIGAATTSTESAPQSSSSSIPFSTSSVIELSSAHFSQTISQSATGIRSIAESQPNELSSIGDSSPTEGQPPSTQSASVDQPSAPPASRNHANTTAVVGGAVGGILFILVVILVLYLQRRLRRKTRSFEMHAGLYETYDKATFVPLTATTASTSALASIITPYYPEATDVLIREGGAGSLGPASKRQEANRDISELAAVRDRLQRTHDEMERQLFVATQAEQTLDVARLQHEILTMRAQIDELRSSAVYFNPDAPPPSYVSEVMGSSVGGEHIGASSSGLRH